MRFQRCLILTIFGASVVTLQADGWLQRSDWETGQNRSDWETGQNRGIGRRDRTGISDETALPAERIEGGPDGD